MNTASFIRWALLPALLALALFPVAAQTPGAGDAVQRIQIRAEAIERFNPREPEQKRFGALTFRGGLSLESPYRHFGGLSGLRVAPDGQHFLSVTDRGHWLRGRIVYRGTQPIAVTDAEMAPILGADGRALNRRGWYDTEALAEDNGTLYVGIERVNEIVRFDYARQGLLARGVPIAVPRAMKKLPFNKSLECLAVVPRDLAVKGGLAAGTLIAISERGPDIRSDLPGFLLGAGEGAFTLKRSDGFDVSDCAITPGGDLLVLERRFSWVQGVAMRIRSVPLAAIKPGALLDGTTLIYADMGYQIDNMEGLSVHRGADGASIVTMVSDDNFSPLQRTLLLQFSLTGE